MTDKTESPLADRVADLQDEARELEDRAKRDGLIPDESRFPEGGIGPQTGAVP